MGIYLNPANNGYSETKNGKVFVDKSLLIDYTNQVIKTPQKNICISRPRRFGKSTDANMLVAYYSKGCDSLDIFNDLKISQTELYQKHINKHNVIHIDVQKFLSNSEDIDKMIKLLTQRIINEIKKEYDVELFDETSLSMSFEDIFAKTGEQFVFIIDEWDCIFREYKEDKEAQEKYLDYLRLLFKEQPYVELVYMTGILPIKKYGTHSALNMFKEISMVNPTPLEEFMGFTEKEVENLCCQYKMEYEKMKETIMVELKKQFRPEFLNRIDDIIVFHSLNKEDISQIVKLMCKTLVKRLDEMTIKLEMDEDAIDLIAKSGFDLEYGARPLKRSIQKELENELSELILQGTIKSGDIVEATVKEGKMTFEVK